MEITGCTNNDCNKIPAKYSAHASSQDGGGLKDIQIWRVDDVARFLGCSVGHVYNLVSDEKIPRIKKGKFVYFIPEDIHNWVLEGDLR